MNQDDDHVDELIGNSQTPLGNPFNNQFDLFNDFLNDPAQSPQHVSGHP